MNLWWTYFVTFFAILYCKGLIIIDDYDPGQCDKSNHGTQMLVLDRENKEKILICTKNDGVYQWTTPGGDDPIGELFSPGFDCSKILDSNPEAKDGMYWIHLGGYYPKQVYCDMTTDGGGYFLVGRKNNSITWTLPSNDLPVEPYGDPHWASNLGDAPILDFRVQIATSEDFQQTKAHWSFRLQSQRPLKKLMVDDQGCDMYKPGIGNIAYVKDIQTEQIVTTGYRCSIFGKFYHPSTGLGWHKMNSCLNKPCASGYAFWEHPKGGAWQMDFHGSFSFSVSGNHSGLTHDATAFVGCSPNQICCGCFGPVGGTDDYCSPDCTAKNGGTVVKKDTYTWFWVRTSIPKRVWNKCMEYKVKNENGDMISYRLFDGNTTPEKGNCPKDEALLNEGIVVVPDAETGKKVPEIPGLLEYRKDTKELYLRANKTWKIIAPEKKILEMTSKMVIPKLKSIEEKLQKQNRTLNKVLKSDIVQLKMELKSDVSQLKTGLNTNVSQLENQDTELKSDITKLKADKTRLEDNISGMKKVIENMNDTLNNLVSLVKDPGFSESVILSGELHYDQLLKSWIGRSFTHASLCWRATRDGWSASTFHSKCNYKKPTVTLVKVGSYIFGGYATKSWDGGVWKQAPGSFIFSLRNKENLSPFKAPLKDQNTQFAMYTGNSYGPIFGGGNDIHISDNAASNTNSYTSFNQYYQAPSGVSDANTILAGTYYFQPSEVEVFHIV